MTRKIKAARLRAALAAAKARSVLIPCGNSSGVNRDCLVILRVYDRQAQSSVIQVTLGPLSM
jgi:hypothetical protein